MLREAWAALGGADDALAQLTVTRAGRRLGDVLAVDELADASVGAALVAAAELGGARSGRRPAATLDAAHVAAAFGAERTTLLDGASPGSPFDPLSAFMPAADGWVRLHGNYPHHRAALRAGLGLPVGADVDAVRAAVARRSAIAVEEAVVEAGGCAAAVRDPGTWAHHPQGRAIAAEPLIDIDTGAAGAPPLPALPPAAPPASGVRVLDLTRVIAGPVGTRMLAALGAQVLRIDPPALSELELQVIAMGAGKRSALLDLRSPGGRAQIEALLAGADVLVQGYRPGALAAFGLDAQTLAARHPKLTTVTFSAWGSSGPWAMRRGFDSLVQAATGIATACAAPGSSAPGALPVQALDHATGYLVAAAALRGLTARTLEGRPLHARLALARTAAWLLAQPRPSRGATDVDAAPFRVELRSPLGTVSTVAPAGRLDDRALAWDRGPVALGADEPRWW